MLLCRAMTMTRRNALGLLTAASAMAVAKRTIPLLAQGAVASTPVFPRGAVIRTLLKDMPPESLASGASLFHEHLSMKYPLGATEHFTDDVALMIEEAKAAKADGVACLVDGGHADMIRSLDALKRITTESVRPP